MWLEFVIGSLATYRLTSLVTWERGPFWMFKRFRAWVRREAPKKSHLDEGVECPYCVGLWASALVTTFLWWRGAMPGADWPLWWLGMAGLAIGWVRWIGK